MELRAVNEKEEIAIKKQANETKLKFRKRRQKSAYLIKEIYKTNQGANKIISLIKQITRKEKKGNVKESGKKKFLCPYPTTRKKNRKPQGKNIGAVEVHITSNENVLNQMLLLL